MMVTRELYTSRERVRLLMRLPNAFSASTNPSLEQVDSLIENKMSYIDEQTGSSFRLSQNREYKDINSDFWTQSGARIPLNRHGIITPLSSAAGDSLKVWDGTDWDQKLDGTWTEGRANDFWIDEIEGVLHIVTKGQVSTYKTVDITYRYNNGARALLNDGTGINTTDLPITYDNLTGVFPYQGWFFLDDEEIRYSSLTSTVITAAERGAFNTTAASHSDDAVIFYVPSDIVECCTMLVALDLLNSEDWSSGGMNSGEMPSGQLPVQGKMEEWRRKTASIIAHRRKSNWSVR